MKSRVLIQFCIAFLVAIILLYILIENVTFRKKIHIDQEQYRTVVYKCVQRGIEADDMKDSVLALAANASASGGLQALVDLVGGTKQLSQLARLDVDKITRTFTLHEQQIRTVAKQTGHLSSHVLHDMTNYTIDQQTSPVVTHSP